MIDLLENEHRRHLALTIGVAAGLAAYLTGSVRSVHGFDLAMLLALVGGFPIYFNAVSGLARLRMSADLAVSLAALAALAIGQYAVAAEVVLIMLIGEALENFAVGRTRSGIAALLALRPQEARVRRDERERVVPADDISANDVVLVRPGDRIPVDGRVLRGSSAVDQSPITGESMPVDKLTGDEVFAGTINLNGALELSVTRMGRDTTLEQIIQLVEEAEEAKAPTQRLADKYAAFFVPAVILAAAATYLLTRDMVRSVAVLVVACPCALVLATPTAIAAGIGRLVRMGILVKGGATLENLGRLRAVLFDKTGTLTCARPRVSQVVAASGYTPEQVLSLAAAVERHSEHPLGKLMVEEARKRDIDLLDSADFAAHPGLGATAKVAGALVRVGSDRLIDEAGVVVPDPIRSQAGELSQAGCTVVLVARGAETVGAVGVQDTVRPEARGTVDGLRALGIQHLAMLTGDHAEAARPVADALGMEEVHSELLPQDKVNAVKEMQRVAAPVAMVGDGINDAPSLVAADVGVALADIGTDVAVGSADVVLVGDDLRKLLDAVVCGRRVRRIIWQNIIGFAFAFNVLAVVVASLGWIGPVAAAVVHQVSSLVVVLNSLRLLLDVKAWRERAGRVGRAVWQRRRNVAAWCGGVAVLAYWLSGLHEVRIGEQGVVQRFGRVVRPVEAPGLHYCLPYPFGRVRTVRTGEVRRVEVGFRTTPGAFAEPPAYDWNVQHRGGRYVRRSEEAEVWAGDEKLVDANLVVHYRVAEPLEALFGIGERQPDGTSKWDALVRAAAEAGLHEELSRRPIDAGLASARAEIEQAIRSRVAQTLSRCGAGFRVEAVCLCDMHPPLEVVPAFREVASALEEKEARINEALAYQNETHALAQGQAAATLRDAEAFQSDRTQRARGGASRFAQVVEAYSIAPGVARLRLYLQTVEEALAGRRKIILDRAAAGTRRLLFLGDAGLLKMITPKTTDPTAPEGTPEQ